MVAYMTSLTLPSPLVGTADPAFTPVVTAFAAQLSGPAGRGGALCVIAGDRCVVDVAGGPADAAGARPWLPGTRACVFSAGKGPLALLAHLTALAGRLDLGDPVARVWPEFAAADKESVTTLQLLEHSAGLPAVRADLPPGALFDWSAMTDALAAERPWWEPGSRHGYHLTTFGWLVGEVVRRATAASLPHLLADLVTGPTGSDFTWGATSGDLAELTAPVPAPTTPATGDDPAGTPMDVLPPSPELLRAATNPPDMLDPDLEQRDAWRAAVVPASNGYASARGLARVYAALLRPGQGGLPITRSQVDDLARERRNGRDAVLGLPTRFSAGFMLPSPTRPFGCGDRVFGHPGTGGTIAFADLDADLALAFVPGRQLTSGTGGDPRWQPVLDAVHACL
jgi:CubicO group peptidase (beta-lactamase class C family)